MRYIKTFVGALIAFLAATLFLAAALVLAVPSLVNIFESKKNVRKIIHKFMKWSSAAIIYSVGCKIICSGKENIPKDSGICLVSNHNGIFDILIIFATVGVPVGFVAKKEILYVPFINLWVLILGGMYIDRSSPRKTVATMQKCTNKIKNGSSIAIFPEGTRSKGRGLLPFKSGSFKMAVDSGAQIIPVATTGGYDVFEKNGLVNSRTLYISYGTPIDTEALPAEHKRQAACEMAYNAVAGMLQEHPSCD
ncbi:MAG: lysophospholipid acyltransferase family protein [Termitinemataceae bacterium]|nr:MAG: lysophospholipid acyltransferase family protein [Termitinemataceae bacterium]